MKNCGQRNGARVFIKSASLSGHLKKFHESHIEDYEEDSEDNVQVSNDIAEIKCQYHCLCKFRPLPLRLKYSNFPSTSTSSTSYMNTEQDHNKKIENTLIIRIYFKVA